MNEIGRKTFFWYRVYLAVLSFLYLAVAIFGVVLIFAQPGTREYTKEQLLIMGVLYIVLGVVFFVVAVVAMLLPPRPYNWILGLIMIILGVTSCCFWPICIPLLIYWFKPETKAFFGRT